MFNTIVGFSLRNRLFVLVAALLVSAYGMWTLTLGVEDGDNTDVPATGGPTADDQAAERSS